MAIIVYVVLIVLILALASVAAFCIARGRSLVWHQRGWTHWTIACR